MILLPIGNFGTIQCNIISNVYILFYLDISPPSFNSKIVNIVRNAHPLEPSVIVSWNELDLGVTDDSGSFKLSSNHRPGSKFGIGTTVVQYIAEDDSGNTASYSFEVIVQGNILYEHVQNVTKLDTK